MTSAGLVSSLRSYTSQGILSEIGVGIVAGSASLPFTVDGMWLDYQQQLTLNFTTTSTAPYVSWASAFKPSPGWFIGQDSVLLANSSSGPTVWSTLQNVPIYAYTSGIDVASDWYSTLPTGGPYRVGLGTPRTGTSAPVAPVGYADFTPIGPTVVGMQTYRMNITIDFRGMPGGEDIEFTDGIAATHKDGYHIYQTSAAPGKGITGLARYGERLTAENELAVAKVSEIVYDYYTLKGIREIPGKQRNIIRVNSDYPNFSFGMKVTGSADWFIGVDSVPLYSNGKFQTVSVPLSMLDAGVQTGSQFYEYGDPMNGAVGNAPAALFPGSVAVLTLTPFAPDKALFKSSLDDVPKSYWGDYSFWAVYNSHFRELTKFPALYWASRGLTGVWAGTIAVIISTASLLGRYRELRKVRATQMLRLLALLCASLFICLAVLLGLYGADWAVASQHMKRFPITVGQTNRIIEVDALVELHVGLSGFNVTVTGTPPIQSGHYIGFNEFYSWEWDQVSLGESYVERTERGVPYGIALISEAFLFDGEDIRWGRYYRYGGYNCQSLLWSSFGALVILVLVFSIAHHAALVIAYLYIIIAFGITLGTSLWLGLVNVPWQPFLIKITNDAPLQPRPGWNMYLCYAGAAVSFITGTIMWVRARRKMLAREYTGKFLKGIKERHTGSFSSGSSARSIRRIRDQLNVSRGAGSETYDTTVESDPASSSGDESDAPPRQTRKFSRATEPSRRRSSQLSISGYGDEELGSYDRDEEDRFSYDDEYYSQTRDLR